MCHCRAEDDRRVPQYPFRLDGGRVRSASRNATSQNLLTDTRILERKDVFRSSAYGQSREGIENRSERDRKRESSFWRRVMQSPKFLRTCLHVTCMMDARMQQDAFFTKNTLR